ncbi:hypothetical protein [Anaplasma platys]|uniref:hypothetical protein n=1 Tax=Anaplasma platys TaxID=949 RepID=UPI00145C7EE0|nr:hypothetical protein [Anaplasma platys]
MDPTESDTAASAFDKEKSTEVLKTETVTINKKGRPYTVTQRLPRDASKHYVLNLEEIPVTCSTVLVQCSQHGKSLQYLGNTCEKMKKTSPIDNLIRSSNHLLNDPYPLEIAFSAIESYIAQEEGDS